jgi:glucokinase
VGKDLLEEDLVEPIGEGASSGGRPPDMLRFKAEHGCILAVEITAESLSFLLADLNGNELDTLKVSLAGSKTTPDAICSYINENLDSLLRKKKKTREQLLLMVVGVPAITNVEEGSVLSISTFEGWRSVPLRAMLGKIVECLVIVENDTNLAAQGERYFGAARSEQDFVLIQIGANVGAGIILGGKIHHGSQWSAGEIAYLRLPFVSRRKPTIHEFGELESVLTCSGILASWRQESGKSGRNTQPHAAETDAVRVLNLALAGNALAQKIVQQRADIVADIIINLALILNPSLVLLGGEVGSHPVLIASVQKQLEESEFAVTKIAAGALGDRAVLLGAISVGLDAITSVLLPSPRD